MTWVMEMEEVVLSIEKEEEEALEMLRNELEELLFRKQKVGIYLKSKVPLSPPFLHRIFTLFFDYHASYLLGIEVPKKRKMCIYHEPFRNGEVLRIDTPSILTGDIHEEAEVHLSTSLYVSGYVKGTIYLETEEAFIYADAFLNARIIYPHDIRRVAQGTHMIWDANYGGEKTWRELSLLPVEKAE